MIDIKVGDIVKLLYPEDVDEDLGSDTGIVTYVDSRKEHAVKGSPWVSADFEKFEICALHGDFIKVE